MTITQLRRNCIGCNACVEAAPTRWAMSRKDGKCTLVGATEKKGFYTVRVSNTEREDTLRAARNCPVKIIQVSD
jgi:ferredoxin